MNGPNRTVAPTPVRPARDLSWIGPALVIVFTALLFAWAVRLLEEPSFVGSVQIANPIQQAVDVDVRQGDGPWLPLAVVDAQSTTTVYDVVDDGGPWIVRFKVSGELLATTERSHESLERANWRITVPNRVD